MSDNPARYPLHGHYFGRSIRGIVRPDEILTARTRYLLAGHAKLHETATTGRTAYMSGDTGRPHGPLTAVQALRADGGSAVDERAARLAFARRAIASSIARDPWSSDPDRTTRHWRPGSAR